MPWARWVDPANRLTAAQRYFYLVGGLQWFNELLTLAFTSLMLLGGLALLMGWGIGVRPLLGALVVVPLVFLVLGLWRFLWALRHTLHLGWGRALRAMGNFFSLSWVVTLGCIQGLIQPRGVFLRTPKAKTRSGLLRALRATQWESGLGLACALVGTTLAVTYPSFTVSVLVVLLLWQAGFFLAAPAYSLLSVRGEEPAPIPSRGEIQGRFVPEGRAARWAMALGVLLMLGFGLLRFLPEPAATPSYARFQPVELQPQELIGAPPLPTPTRVPRTSPTAVPASDTPTPTVSPTAPGALTQTSLPARAPTETPLPPTQPPTDAPPLSTQPPTDTPPPPVQAPTTTLASPTHTATVGAPQPTPPTQAPLPTQVPTQAPTQPPPPTQAPTQAPLPTQAPTQPPAPTQAPTQSPLPTQAPTGTPGAPTQAPTQPPPPTQPPRPV
jgi:hypothetical protein